MQKVEREMRLMRERLPPDNQEALEMALSEVVGSQGAAFSRVLESNSPLFQKTPVAPRCLFWGEEVSIIFAVVMRC